MSNIIYRQNLFLLFILTVIFIVAYAVLNVIFNNSKIFKAIGFVGAAISLFSILNLTIFNRQVANYDVELSPFYSLVLAKTRPEYYRVVFMNSLLYVPFGTFLPYLLSSKYKKSNLVITVLLSLAISIIIEGLQYFYSIGLCETDDVIFNTFGAFVGTFGYLLFGYLIKKFNSK